MFWMRNKENSFPIRTLIWSPGVITWKLLHRLSISNVLDKPEAFFVNTSRRKKWNLTAFYKNGAKHTHGCLIRILSSEMSLCPWYNMLRRGFFLKNDTADFEEFVQKWYLLLLWLLNIKVICGYFQCTPFPHLATDRVVLVLSFDH